MDPALTIGEFARITHLTVRMLRRHHDTGLLVPDRIDPRTGYRRYSLAQVPTAQTIRRFRDLGLPVPELRELLATPDGDRRDAIVVAHLERLEDQLSRTQEAIGSLRALLDPDRRVPVERAVLPARTVLAVESLVDAGAVLDWYAAARSILDAAVAGGAGPVAGPAAGPVGGRYDHALFTEGRGAVLAYAPCRDPRPGNGTTRLELPARDVAVVTHHGTHDDIDLSYAALGTWVAREGVGVDGPVEELYDVGPADDPDPGAWRTRIAWPVRPAA